VPIGVEVRVLRNGKLLFSQVFPWESGASAFADDEGANYSVLDGDGR
jgi:hypothetical protein